MKYSVNSGNRDFAIRLGCEEGVYKFITDYAADMGMSRSSALRRLALIGARCEKEHGLARMPASYSQIAYDPSEIVEGSHNPLDAGEEDKPFDWGE